MQKNTLRLIWSASKPYAKYRNIALVFSVLSVVVETYLAPLVLATFIDQLTNGRVSLSTSMPLILLYAGLLVASTIITWRITLWGTWTFEIYAMRDMAVRIIDHLSRRSMNFHANKFGGSLISQSTKLVSATERLWDILIWDTVPIIVGIVSASAILAFIIWQYALFLFVVTILMAIAIYYGNRFVYERVKKETRKHTELTGAAADIITNIATVKAFSSERRETARVRTRANTWNHASFHTRNGVLFASGIWATIIVLFNVGALIIAVYASERGLLTAGAAYLLLTYTLILARQLWSMNHVMRNYNRLMGDAYDMTEIMQEDIEIADKGTQKLTASAGEIKLTNISFTHDNGNGVAIFRDFSLAIPSGQRVGLVGHSGSGKTTLTRLLLRFSDIDAGTITIDGQNIADITQRSLRQNIAYVSQEPMLFHRSLAENIAYGRPDASPEDIVHAAKQANADEFIGELADGYDTLVGERGIKLSGGQRQRIAIARAILKDAPILVLDEATSALDSESEKLIQASLDTLMKDRTSIVIAHRLSTISKLDRIIVLSDGQIVEDGSHTELLALDGTYAKLWTHQSGGFIEE